MSEITLRAGSSPSSAILRHPFPVIDFKFRSTGTAGSFLTKFFVDVISIDIDPTPVLQFDWALGPLNSFGKFGIPQRRNNRSRKADRFEAIDTLKLRAQNVGWGPASGVNLALQTEELHLLFPHAKQKSSVVELNDFVDLFSFAVSEMDLNYFEERSASLEPSIRDDVAREQEWKRIQKKVRASVSQDEYDQMNLEGALPVFWQKASPIAKMLLKSGRAFLKLPSIYFDWSCFDVRGGAFTGSESFDWNQELFYDADLFLAKDGFDYSEGEMGGLGAGMPPGPIFCVILNADDSIGRRSYSISRSIEAGGLERFQMLIGANKSCYVNLKIGFLDGTREIQSGLYEIRVRNLFSDKYHEMYRDGQVILEPSVETVEDFYRSSENA